MKKFAALLVAILVVVAQLPLTFPSTVPAFLWSSHGDGSSTGRIKDVNYQSLSPKDLVKSVMTEGGWSNSLCLGKAAQQPLDILLLLLRRELQSSDIIGNKHEDSSLVDLLKVSFMRSNFSLAFPYVATSDETDMESSLISEFTNTCGNDIGLSKVAFLESCAIKGDNMEKLVGLNSVRDYLVSRLENGPKGQAELLTLCQGGSSSSRDLDQRNSQSQGFSELISFLEQSGARYSVLYVSDPLRSIQYPSYREVERFLAEGTFGNGSVNSKSCDGVCQIKSSLLEGIFVGIVLLIILISGLCCMMGIDSPTRFEVPQDS